MTLLLCNIHYCRLKWNFRDKVQSMMFANNFSGDITSFSVLMRVKSHFSYKENNFEWCFRAIIFSWKHCFSLVKEKLIWIRVVTLICLKITQRLSKFYATIWQNFLTVNTPVWILKYLFSYFQFYLFFQLHIILRVSFISVHKKVCT